MNEAERCSTCQRLLDMPGLPESQNCGGDCVECMADAGDPDCIEAMREIMKERTIRFRSKVT